MTGEDEVPAWPHKPAPPEPKRLIPEWPMLWRGLALAAASVVCLVGGGAAIRRLGVAGLAAFPALGAVGALFAWAAAIHLTGGERFDDHKWV